MEGLNTKTLALFFTKGMSLRRWDELGMLEREVLLYRQLAPHFKKIYFFTYGDRADMQYEQILGGTIAVLPNKYGLPSKLYSVLLPLFYPKEIRRADILKTNQMAGSWAAVIAKCMGGAKLVVRCGYEWLEVMERRTTAFWKLKLAALLERLSYTSADIAVFSNEADKEYARKRFDLNPEHLSVVPNFVDTRVFKPLPVQKEKGRIIFVGKLEEQKNVFSLIEAVSSLGLRLVVIGDGSLRSQLNEFARGANVEFLGSLPNSRLPEELNKSELFVLPSLYEGHPKALLEAMSCGLPCVGTRVKGIDAVIRHKENGYLAQPAPESLASAIKELLGDEALARRLGNAARQTVAQRFSLQRVVSRELELYRRLLDS